MTVYILRDGRMIEKSETKRRFVSDFPTPRVSRFESFDSPVDGKSVSSWRQRDRDMAAVDAVDRRDIPQAAFEKRQRMVERNARADEPG